MEEEQIPEEEYTELQAKAEGEPVPKTRQVKKGTKFVKCVEKEVLIPF